MLENSRHLAATNIINLDIGTYKDVLIAAQKQQFKKMKYYFGIFLGQQWPNMLLKQFVAG